MHSDLNFADEVYAVHFADRLEQLSHGLSLINGDVYEDCTLSPRVLCHKLICLIHQGDGLAAIQAWSIKLTVIIMIVHELLQDRIQLLPQNRTQLRWYLVDNHWK